MFLPACELDFVYILFVMKNKKELNLQSFSMALAAIQQFIVVSLASLHDTSFFEGFRKNDLKKTPLYLFTTLNDVFVQLS